MDNKLVDKTSECGADLTKEKGYKRLTDDAGRFVGHAVEYNGHIYSYFGDNFVDRLNGYKTNFPVYEDDIYLLAYPKSGTHWLWEILMMLTRGSPTVREEHKHEMMLELGFDASKKGVASDGPRIINTHLLYDDMPPALLSDSRAKFIQIHRNPADVAVSFYHHLKKEVKLTELSCDWEEYLKMFCNDKLMLHSTWYDYTCQWWPSNQRPNFLSVFYEDLKQKPKEAIQQIAQFLGVYASADLVEGIASSTSFQNMKAGKREKEIEELGQYFNEGYSMYRKGIIGDWRNHFTREQHQQFLAFFNKKLQDFPELREKYLNYIAEY